MGTYVTLAATRAIEALDGIGLDFVRFDLYRFPWDHLTTSAMVTAARAAGLTTWVRSRNEAWEIGRLVDLGAQIVTVPNIGSAAAARAAADAVFPAPKGRRDYSVPENVESAHYLSWSQEQVMLGVQIEDAEGLANAREIIQVSGVDIVHTGRTDIAAALDLPGQQFHPKVLEAERRVVEMSLEAGKQVALFYPLTGQGLDLARSWIEAGVRIFAVDNDFRALRRAFVGGVHQLRGVTPVTSSRGGGTQR